MRKRFVQDPQTGRLVPREEYRRPQPVHGILPDIEAFVSPVDGRVISSRPRLREHNAEHGVAQHGDYGENNGAAYFARAERARQTRLQAQDAASRRERLDTIIRAVDQHTRRD
jgi:hypothetical protein